MTRTHIKVRLLMEEAKMAKDCSEEFFSGNLSSVIRKAIRDWHRHRDEYRAFEKERVTEIKRKIREYKKRKRRIMAEGLTRLEIEEFSEVDRS